MQKRMITPRIQKLISERNHMVSKAEIPVRDQAYRDASKQYQNKSVKIQFAHGFAETLRRKAILIQEEDLFAGFLYHYTYNVNFPMQVRADFDPTKRASFKMDVHREVQEATQCFGMEEGSELSRTLEEFANGVDVWLYKHWHSGHTLAGYPILLEKGFAGLLEDVQRRKEERMTAQEADTLESFEIVLQASVDYIKRYEDQARQMCEKADSYEQRRRMERIGSALHQIRLGAPQTFFEAIQLVWLAHEMMYCENVPSAISIGRLDYYLYPFYERDVKEGMLDYESAGELIDAFFVKCSSHRKAYQNLTLGGCDREGRCSVNALTYLCLEASANLKFDQPSVNFRWTEDLPDEAWEAVLSLIREGMGFPALMYDPCCIRARERAGIPEEERYNYSILGCVEFGAQGQEHALTELVRLNLPKVLNLMLQGGKDEMSEQQFQLGNSKKLSGIQTYEELYNWYLEEIAYFMKVAVESTKTFEKLYEEKYPLPYLSVLTNDCIGRAKDISEGGARYNSVGFNLCGVATAADSLLAIKKLVFDEKKISLEDLAQILRSNFNQEEHLRQRIVRTCEKFGNDREDVDRTAASLLEFADRELETCRTYHGGRYRLGLYSVEDHAIMGAYTGATADGRMAGVSLSNSMGAVQGMDREGPTSLINSVNRFDMSFATNGMVLDIKFIPAFLEGKTGQDALKNLILTYFHHGGMEIQISVVSREILLAAQREPEKYQNLIVRVSGFSAYFLSLRKVTQDEIIARTECGK